MRTEAAAVIPCSAADRARARALGRALDLPLLAVATRPAKCDSAGLVLLVDGTHLALQLTGKGAPGPISVDFGAASMRHRRRSGHNELLGRAVGVGKKPELQVLDTTAGLGRDSFVLADLGCRVLMSERNPLVQQLLATGLETAQISGDDWLRDVASRLELLCGDTTALAQLPVPCDVIYLDPMFPQRDKSAAVKKEMALFHYLLGDGGDDGDALLHWAQAQDVARIVVKRPPRADYLAGLKPSHEIRGKAVRYDVHVKRALS